MRPRSVVIVGASERPGSLGASVLNGLEQQGFTGEIHLINPNRSTIGSRPCLPNVEALPMGVDAAVLAIPRGGVLDAMRALAKRGVGAVVIFASGYAEGGAAGLEEQREIARIRARSEHDRRRPPTASAWSISSTRSRSRSLNCRRSARWPTKRVSIISQSGAMAAILATTMIARDVPVSGYVSTGNEAFTGVEDFLEHFIADKATRVIGMVVEQFRDPARFLTVARAARAARKTIVLLHPGRSAAARASAATHTGAMAGDYDVMNNPRRTRGRHRGRYAGRIGRRGRDRPALPCLAARRRWRARRIRRVQSHDAGFLRRDWRRSAADDRRRQPGLARRDAGLRRRVQSFGPHRAGSGRFRPLSAHAGRLGRRSARRHDRDRADPDDGADILDEIQLRAQWPARVETDQACADRRSGRRRRRRPG